MEDLDMNILREIEENERWLASHDAPEPSADVLASVKLAVRDELARDRERSFAIRWRPWQGAFAAAAMIMISVGVIRFAALHTDPARPLDLGARFVMEDLDVPEVERSIVDTELDDLEEWRIGESWALSGASMFETFEDALSEDSSEESDEVGATANGSVSGAIG